MIRKQINRCRYYIEESDWDERLLGALLRGQNVLDNICLCAVDFAFFYFGTGVLVSILSK